MTMPNINQDDLAALVTDLVNVQNRLAPLKAEEESLKARLRDLIATAGPGDYQAGDHTLTATATRRLNADKLAENYPPDQFPHLYELKISTAAVRAHLAPAAVDQFMGDAGVMGIRVK